VPHKIGTRERFLLEQIGHYPFKLLSILRMNSIPNFWLAFMEKVDSRKIQVFDVPIEEGSPGTKEKERSIEPVYLFSDDIRKE
jgi:hypothetical protein